MASPDRIGLAELLAQIRIEIDLAQENLRQSKRPGLLEWDEAEVEVSFGVKKEVDAKGGVHFHIFAIEAGGKYTSEEVHRIKLHMKPAAGIEAPVIAGPEA